MGNVPGKTPAAAPAGNPQRGVEQQDGQGASSNAGATSNMPLEGDTAVVHNNLVRPEADGQVSASDKVGQVAGDTSAAASDAQFAVESLDIDSKTMDMAGRNDEGVDSEDDSYRRNVADVMARVKILGFNELANVGSSNKKTAFNPSSRVRSSSNPTTSRELKKDDIATSSHEGGILNDTDPAQQAEPNMGEQGQDDQLNDSGDEHDGADANDETSGGQIVAKKEQITVARGRGVCTSKDQKEKKEMSQQERRQLRALRKFEREAKKLNQIVAKKSTLKPDVKNMKPVHGLVTPEVVNELLQEVAAEVLKDEPGCTEPALKLPSVERAKEAAKRRAELQAKFPEGIPPELDKTDESSTADGKKNKKFQKKREKRGGDFDKQPEDRIMTPAELNAEKLAEVEQALCDSITDDTERCVALFRQLLPGHSPPPS